MDQAAESHQPIVITGKRHDSVLLSAEDWRAIQETLYLLSVPGMRAIVPRWQHIRYTGVDVLGQPIVREAEGFHARVVQHECDHLIGKLYPMRVRDFSRFGFTSVLFPGLDDNTDD
jgi:peptide deformylase